MLIILMSSTIMILGCKTFEEGDAHTATPINATIEGETMPSLSGNSSNTIETTVTSTNILDSEMVSTTLTQSSSLFLLFRVPPNYSDVRVWRYELSQERAILLFQNSQSDKEFRGYLENLIPAEELAIYNALYGNYPQEEVAISNLFDELSISVASNGQRVAWVEGIGWYPDIFDYGYSQIVVFDTETKNQDIIASYNFHLPLQDNSQILTRPGAIRIISLNWSPDAQFLAIARDISMGAETHFSVYDFREQNLIELEIANESGIPVWSNNSHLLAYTRISDDLTHTSSIEVTNIPLLGQPNSLIVIENDTPYFVSGLNWAPDDSQIVAVASLHDSVSEDILIIADVNKRTIDPISIKDLSPGYFSEPKWSPSGRFIGVNYRSNNNSFVEELIVLDPSTGQVLANLPLERPESSWDWIQTEDIALVTGQAPITTMQILLWHWQPNDTNLELEDLDDFLRDIVDEDNPHISILGQ